MGTLTREDGFTIIESLVSIILLSLFVGLSVMVVNGIFSRPQMLLKGEACILAAQFILHSRL
jgi:type II secretory pathway component PulJ